MDNRSKFCRFCLLEVKSDSNDTLINIFDQFASGLYDELQKIGLHISPEDAIPPLVCANCLEFIEKMVHFLQKYRNSENILNHLYDIKNEDIDIHVIKESPTKISNTFGHCTESFDSDSSESDDRIRKYMKKQRLCRPTSARTCIEPNQKEYLSVRKVIKSDGSESSEDVRLINNSPISFFTGGQKFNIYNKVENVQNYSCSMCAQIFDNSFDYQDHQNAHDGQCVYCCSKCSQIFSNRIDLREHESSHKVACKICNLEVLPKSLPGHMTKHTDLYKCSACDSRHSSRAAMESHFRARHERLKGYVCHVCGKQNSVQASYRRHLATHLPHRPFKCKICAFAANSKSVLKVHVLRKHSCRQAVCDICTNVFKSELSLQQHKKRMHEPKRHGCKRCGKRFSEKFNLDQHTRKKHVKQRVYECKVCHQEFLTVQKLRDHRRSHRSGCVECRKCGKEFFYKKYLQKHEQKCLSDVKTEDDEKKSISVPDTSDSFNNK